MIARAMFARVMITRAIFTCANIARVEHIHSFTDAVLIGQLK
jgi:hypothetical protein